MVKKCKMHSDLQQRWAPNSAAFYDLVLGWRCSDKIKKNNFVIVFIELIINYQLNLFTRALKTFLQVHIFNCLLESYLQLTWINYRFLLFNNTCKLIYSTLFPWFSHYSLLLNVENNWSRCVEVRLLTGQWRRMPKFIKKMIING